MLTSVPPKLTTAASMQSVITLRDPSIVAARMDLVEMASIVLVTINFVAIIFFNMMTNLTMIRKCFYAKV